MTDTAVARTFTIKRPRGAMEELMREVCDQIALGVKTLPDGEFWTVARIANLIHAEFPGSGVKPSVGAVADNLRRWGDIGFAVINEKPLAFVDFTQEGRAHGLSALKARAAEERKAERLAAREAVRAAKRAAADQAEAAAKHAEENPQLPLIGLDPQQPQNAPSGGVESLRITYTPSSYTA